MKRRFEEQAEVLRKVSRTLEDMRAVHKPIV
jgi:hypothetical protein